MKEKEFKPGCPQLNIQLGCDGWETEIVLQDGKRFSQKCTENDKGYITGNALGFLSSKYW